MASEETENSKMEEILVLLQKLDTRMTKIKDRASVNKLSKKLQERTKYVSFVTSRAAARAEKEPRREPREDPFKEPGQNEIIKNRQEQSVVTG